MEIIFFFLLLNADHLQNIINNIDKKFLEGVISDNADYFIEKPEPPLLFRKLGKTTFFSRLNKIPHFETNTVYVELGVDLL
jgi:hypothetical protein